MYCCTLEMCDTYLDSPKILVHDTRYKIQGKQESVPGTSVCVCHIQKISYSVDDAAAIN